MIKLEAGECIGAYRVVEFLARGGFSLVYLADGDVQRIEMLPASGKED